MRGRAPRTLASTVTWRGKTLKCQAGIALAGASPSGAQPKELAGTAWQLVETQSTDDTVERPDDRSRYTMRLDADGAVAMRLN